jgi:hypothetical protein
MKALVFALSAGLFLAGCVATESGSDAARQAVFDASLCKYARQEAVRLESGMVAEHCYPHDNISIDRSAGGRFAFQREFTVKLKGDTWGLKKAEYSVSITGQVVRREGRWKVDESSLSIDAYKQSSNF